MNDRGAPDRRLHTLERLLALPAIDIATTVAEAAQLLAEALPADKVDVFFHHPENETLVAAGTSDTPMGRRQWDLGLNRLPIANEGRTVEVFLTGRPFLTGQADQDPGVLIGVKKGLGVRSMMAVPLTVAGERRGVLAVAAARPAAFDEDDLRFLQTVARWLDTIIHRAELVERTTADAIEAGRRKAAEELITIVAHDLGNLLTPLKGRIDLIRRRAVKDGETQYAEDAEVAAGTLLRLRRLTANLLDVGRLEQGILALNLAMIDLAQIAREAAEDLRGDQSNLDVRTAHEVCVEADPDRVRQVIENLLSNALRHSPAGTPVWIEAKSEQRDDRVWATVAVGDEGPGIPPDLLPRIFDRFVAGSRSGGLGIGLYLARRIAEAHGGDLTVESAPGRGSRFTLAIPAL